MRLNKLCIYYLIKILVGKICNVATSLEYMLVHPDIRYVQVDICYVNKQVEEKFLFYDSRMKKYYGLARVNIWL